MPNRLAKETSPYLLQHKDNPVDWYPWGDEAFERARNEDRPVFLSIGYSACHWCHVMERESFENDEIAALMNERFVNIKVDREERPDVDSIYMSAVQAMTGSGGWPMSIFMTPDGKPYFTGTYFPPDDRGGMTAFPRVLAAAADAYRDRKEEVLATTSKIVEQLEGQTVAHSSTEPLTRETKAQAFSALRSMFDSEHGGFGGAPKFPQAMALDFLLRYWHETKDQQALSMVEVTLTKMALGGIYDQVGGGFARYATDDIWLVPHFEKMLYDNALLVPVYTHAWQVTGKALYRRVVEETLRYAEREMLQPSGGFSSAQDADSEGVEGKFFVWEASDVDGLLGEELGRIARAYYGLTDHGNFEGRNILSIPEPEEEVLADLGISADELAASVATIREKLFAEREKRIKPGLDDKILTAWNALMLKAFAEAGAAFDEPAYVDIARRNAEFLLESLVRDGRLLRTWKAGSAKLNGYLEDYGYLIDALLSLYEATFEQRWLADAESLAKSMIDLFYEADEGVFYDTGSDHERLLFRPREVSDNATPSGGSSAAMALFRLAVFTGDADYQRAALSSLRSVHDMLTRAPTGFANWLSALDFYLSTPKEIVIMGPPDNPATQALLRVARGRYLPNRALAGAASPVAGAASPLLEGRELVDDKPTAYVCESYACQLPVSTPEELVAQLEAGG